MANIRVSYPEFAGRFKQRTSWVQAERGREASVKLFGEELK
jgi:hypothetical protein